MLEVITPGGAILPEKEDEDCTYRCTRCTHGIHCRVTFKGCFKWRLPRPLYHV